MVLFSLIRIIRSQKYPSENYQSLICTNLRYPALNRTISLIRIIRSIKSIRGKIIILLHSVQSYYFLLSDLSGHKSISQKITNLLYVLISDISRSIVLFSLIRIISSIKSIRGNIIMPSNKNSTVLQCIYHIYPSSTFM